MAKVSSVKRAEKPEKQVSIRQRLRGLPAIGGAPQFKFETPGDEFYARYLGRRQITVKKKEETARILDVDIIDSTVDGEDGPTGQAGTFESVGITMIMDQANLSAGDVFYLRFDSLDGRFKKFAFKKLSTEEVAELLAEIDNVPF
jgi:hypothetical protein